MLVAVADDARTLALLDTLPEIEATRAESLADAVRDAEDGGDVVLAGPMEGRGAAEVVRALREGGCELPVVALAAGEEADAALAAGAADVLTPEGVTAARLGRALRRAADEAALRARARQLATLVDELPGMFYRCRNDRLWTMELVSEGARELTGYTAAELRENPLLVVQIIAPEDRERVWREVQEAVARGIPYELEYRVQRRDGRVRWVEDRGRAVEDADGGPALLEGFIADVTERRQVEEALRRSGDYFRALTENSGEAVGVGNADGTFRYVSPSVERVTGRGPEEWLRLNLFHEVHPDDVPMVREAFAEMLGTPGASVTRTVRVRGGGGEWRRLEVTARNLLHDPAVGGIVYNSRDVTAQWEADEELRRHQQQLLQSQKMEAVGRLAGGVAHDFNNLLTAILGNAELLLMELAPDAAERPEVEEIRRAAERASGLTRQLLAFSRRQVLQPRVLDLNAVVAEMERMLRRLIGEDVELVTRLDPAVARVRADPGQVEQVVMNLVVNARDAMPSGGRLWVETRRARLGEEARRDHPYVEPGDYVLLAVSDTGHGMDAETRERAFEPFFTTRPAGQGTGLGLSTVYGIVKQSGGYVWLDSEPGRGTTVRVYLPPADGAEAEAPAARREGAAPLPRGAGTLLLVEDEEAVRKLARRVLQRSGYTVLEAGDGEEALRVAAAHRGRIDLLLTDVVMPRMGGRELAAKLVEERPGMGVLYFSGYTDEAVARHGMLDPGTSFIEKPFTPDALASRVRQVIERPHPAS